MSLTRIYQSIPLSVGDSISLDETASHRLLHVLRVKIGEQITLFNGEGGEYEAMITELNKKKVTVKILAFINRDSESPLSIHLAQGIARGEKMDFIVQKAVELGVIQITPLVTARTNVRLSHEREEKRLLHWQSVIIGACEQSGRNRLPKMNAHVALKDWLGQTKADGCFVLTPHGETKLSKSKWPKTSKSVILLIGPEGGLSQEEIESAVKNGFMELNLGPRVLRTETASIAAIAVLQCLFGDFC